MNRLSIAFLSRFVYILDLLDVLYLTFGCRSFDVDSLPPLVESHCQRIADVLEDGPDVFIR